MTQTRLLVRPTRNVRDLYLRKRYVVVAATPGGRETLIAKEPTRRRAFERAVEASAPQTSPTAGAGAGDVGGATSGGVSGGVSGTGGADDPYNYARYINFRY